MSGPQDTTGRVKDRTRPLYCHGCGIRRLIGVPKARDAWTSQLTLTKREHDMLLLAAAEYEECGAECRNCKHEEHLRVCGYIDPTRRGEPCVCARYEARGDSNAVDFVDWIRGDVVVEKVA